ARAPAPRPPGRAAPPAGETVVQPPRPRPTQPPSARRRPAVSPPPARPAPAPPPSSPPPGRQSAAVELTAPEPGDEEPAADWESLTAEPPGPAPAAATKPPPAAPRSRGRPAPVPLWRQRRWQVAGAAVGLILLIVLVVWLLTRGGGRPGPAAEEKTEPARTLYVSAAGKRDAYGSVVQAYFNARSGDRIVVTDEVHVEYLELDAATMSVRKEVTVSPPPGRRTV